MSSSINKYCYIICRYLPPFFDYKYRIRYREQEETASISEIKHPSARECLAFLNLDEGVEIQHNADVPAMSGLGSSSAFTVGLLNSLYALRGEAVPKKKLALDAIHVEQVRIGESVGSQDQTAAAYGGFNKIEFGGAEEIKVTPLAVNPAVVGELEGRLMLFFTGFSRNASGVAAEQIRSTPQKRVELKAMHAMVAEAERIIGAGTEQLDDFGRLLNEGWRLKRSLTSKITTPFIDNIYETAIKAGALGGKLLGAGGGGFMLLFVPPERQAKVKEALGGLLHVPFKFDKLGSQVIYQMSTEV